MRAKPGEIWRVRSSQAQWIFDEDDLCFMIVSVTDTHAVCLTIEACPRWVNVTFLGTDQRHGLAKRHFTLVARKER